MRASCLQLPNPVEDCLKPLTKNQKVSKGGELALKPKGYHIMMLSLCACQEVVRIAITKISSPVMVISSIAYTTVVVKRCKRVFW